MKFDLNHSLLMLSRTPETLNTLLWNLPGEWIKANEGPETWSAFDIVGHLVHGEKTDYRERIDIILNRPDKHFKPFDRFAQFHESEGKTMQDILLEFSELREVNISAVKSMNLTEADFNKTGIHPVFGEVTLRQLLSTWTVHDLSHLAQIARVMSKQLAEEVGPWIEFLPILTRK